MNKTNILGSGRPVHLGPSGRFGRVLRRLNPRIPGLGPVRTDLRLVCDRRFLLEKRLACHQAPGEQGPKDEAG